MRVIEHLEEHYEVQEAPFGRSYKWSPQSIVVECECDERLTFKVSPLTSSVAVCECESDHTATIERELQRHQPEAPGQMPGDHEATHHPWLYDTRAQAEQHNRDEAAYPEDSPWRYNDVTSRGADDERNVQ